MDEKDRLGDKLREAERGREDQYFAERDRQLLARLKQGQDKDAEQTLREAARMRCPKCGAPLVSKRLHGVAVDECSECGGMFLDKGELKALAERESGGWLARWYFGERE